MACSAWSFAAPYGLVGRCGVCSVIGNSVGAPKVAQEEEKMSLSTPAAPMARRSATVDTLRRMEEGKGGVTRVARGVARRCETASFVEARGGGQRVSGKGGCPPTRRIPPGLPTERSERAL
eukprot:scaffold24279_cov112-Isochrysis_galbana.AAC.7